jgi:hypothetical protein
VEHFHRKKLIFHKKNKNNSGTCTKYLPACKNEVSTKEAEGSCSNPFSNSKQTTVKTLLDFSLLIVEYSH